MTNKTILYFEKNKWLQNHAHLTLLPWGYDITCVDNEHDFLQQKAGYDFLFVHDDMTLSKSFQKKIHPSKNLTEVWTKDSGRKALPHIQDALNRYIIDSPKAREQYLLVNLLLYDCDKQFGDALEKYVTAETLCQVMRAQDIHQFLTYAQQLPLDFGVAFAPQMELKAITSDLEKIVGMGFYLHPSELRGPFVFPIDHLYRRYRLFGPSVCLVEGKRV